MIPESAAIDRAVERLLDRNYESDLFMSLSEAEVEHQRCLERLLELKNLHPDNRPKLDYRPTDPDSDNPFVD